MRNLIVTSPLMRGADVSALQSALNHNDFQAFPCGAVDGQYGPQTAAAVRTAKWFLGYPLHEVNHEAGPYLFGLLTGTIPLPKLWRARRGIRVWAHDYRVRDVHAVEVARTQVGTKENPPGSNQVKYSEWYGFAGPWCAMFVSWCLHQVGSSFHYAYVPFITADARAWQNGIRSVPASEALMGDLAVYHWPGGNPLGDHIGFFSHWLDKAAGSFASIEGNTAIGNDSNGGEVLYRTDRSTSEVVTFVRVTR